MLYLGGMNDVWKEFEQNPLTHSGAHYLMTIHEIAERKGYARTTDVAKALEISVPSCSQSLKSLVKKGLVYENEDKFFLLTDFGLTQVRLVEKNKEILFAFFRDVLGVGEHQADTDSCKMEHLMSAETSEKLCQFLTLLNSPQAEQFMKLVTEMDRSVCKPESCETCPHHDQCK